MIRSSSSSLSVVRSARAACPNRGRAASSRPLLRINRLLRVLARRVANIDLPFAASARIARLSRHEGLEVRQPALLCLVHPANPASLPKHCPQKSRRSRPPECRPRATPLRPPPYNSRWWPRHRSRASRRSAWPACRAAAGAGLPSGARRPEWAGRARLADTATAGLARSCCRRCGARRCCSPSSRRGCR